MAIMPKQKTPVQSRAGVSFVKAIFSFEKIYARGDKKLDRKIKSVYNVECGKMA